MQCSRDSWDEEENMLSRFTMFLCTTIRFALYCFLFFILQNCCITNINKIYIPKRKKNVKLNVVILNGSHWTSICCNVWRFSCFALLTSLSLPLESIRKKIWINAFCFAVMQNWKLLVFLCRLFFTARCKYKMFYISPKVRPVRLF